jgi:hypothetical protein
MAQSKLARLVHTSQKFANAIEVLSKAINAGLADLIIRASLAEFGSTLPEVGEGDPGGQHQTGLT